MEEENERISEFLYLPSQKLSPIVPKLGRHESDFLASGQARPR